MSFSKKDYLNNMKKLRDNFEGKIFSDNMKNKIKEKIKEYNLRFHSIKFIGSDTFSMPGAAAKVPGRIIINYDANNIISSIVDN
jgi:hypothetical protein